jgi:hypothetical protein
MRAAKFEVSDESVGDMRLKDGTIVPQVSQKHGSQTPPSMRCKVLCSCLRHLNLIGCTGVGGSILHIDEGSKTHRSGETIADIRLKQSTIVPQVSQKNSSLPSLHALQGSCSCLRHLTSLALSNSEVFHSAHRTLQKRQTEAPDGYRCFPTTTVAPLPSLRFTS